MREFYFTDSYLLSCQQMDIHFNTKEGRTVGEVLASGERDALASFKSHHDSQNPLCLSWE